ncbi:MAG: DUF2157 domain-containing protein [Cystobacter sp.]
MPIDPLDLAATPERLHALAKAGVLSPAALEQSSRLSVATPRPDAWRRFLSVALLGFGSMLVLSGVIFFFAYNWQALHRFGKLGLVLAAIAGACVAAWRLGEGLAGQFALLFAAVLVGPLLAVYGQVYQTGADAYGLFLGWSMLVLPWVVLARFQPLWLLLLLLVDTALWLYWEEQRTRGLFLLLAAIHGVAWVAHEGLARRGISWLQGRWMPRILAMVTVLPLLGLAEKVARKGAGAQTENVVALGLLGVLLGAMYRFHHRIRPEIFLLTLIALSAIFLVSVALGSLLLDGFKDMSAFFAIGLLLIAQVALAVRWLTTEARHAEET